jgi:hypothetical protein
MANYTQIGDNSPDGVQIGVSSTNKVGFGGKAPVAISALTSYATSDITTASSTAVNTKHAAFMIAVANTMSALGFWPPQS